MTTAECPECGDNYCRCGIDWTSPAETTTATDEDAARVIEATRYYTGSRMHLDSEKAAQALAAAGLLARPTPSRDEILMTIAQGDGQTWPGGMDHHTAEHMYGKQADAVLDLLEGGGDQISRAACGATTNTAGPCVLDPEHITVSAHAGPSGWRWNDSATMARFDTDGGTDESL